MFPVGACRMFKAILAAILDRGEVIRHRAVGHVHLFSSDGHVRVCTRWPLHWNSKKNKSSSVYDATLVRGKRDSCNRVESTKKYSLISPGTQAEGAVWM